MFCIFQWSICTVHGLCTFWFCERNLYTYCGTCSNNVIITEECNDDPLIKVWIWDKWQTHWERGKHSNHSEGPSMSKVYSFRSLHMVFVVLLLFPEVLIIYIYISWGITSMWLFLLKPMCRLQECNEFYYDYQNNSCTHPELVLLKFW